MARDRTIRMSNNSFIKDLASARYTVSSEHATNAYSNSVDNTRYKYWSPTGNFEITSTNNTLYINDGSNKTITLTSASYTGTTLASHIQTQLNASSSGWTVSYSTTTYLFTISNSSSVTLRLSQTTNAAWSTLGFTGSSDVTGTSFLADAPVIHTSESVVWDLQYPANVQSFCAISPIDEVFSLSESATIKLYGNNIDLWSSPPFSETLNRTDNGIFAFFDDKDSADRTFRYWKFEFTDKNNPEGSAGIKLSNLFLGDFLTFDQQRAVSHGWANTLIDPSQAIPSEAGNLFFDTQQPYYTFENLGLSLLKQSHKRDLEKAFKQNGLTTPFYVHVDPLADYSENPGELSKFVHFSSAPSFIHLMRDLYNTSVSFREVI